MIDPKGKSPAWQAFIAAVGSDAKVPMQNADGFYNGTFDYALMEGIRAYLAATVTPAAEEEGWRMVPVEITPEMQRAYFNVIDRNLKRVETDPGFGRHSSNAQAYRAMLAAAPSRHAAPPDPLASSSAPAAPSPDARDGDGRRGG